MRRAPAFVVIGAAGFVVQLLALASLTTFLQVPYALATAVAVESAVLHNFWWHNRWTWADRRAADDLLVRLLRFHVSNGIVSLAGNVAITIGLVELLGLHPAVANSSAVVAISCANFVVADRWVFRASGRTAAAVVAVAAALVLATPSLAAAAPRPETLTAWDVYVARVEAAQSQPVPSAPLHEPRGRTISVPGGTIHEWRGSVLVPGITVGALVKALSNPGLPPPSEDLLEARVLRREGDSLSVYLRVTRSAIVTATYDTEHDVVFSRLSEEAASSRSVATRITEVGDDDRGFLWKLNSYWHYRQVGNAVQIDVLSLSLSRDVPAFARPIAAPLISRISRESMRRTLDAMERFAIRLRTSTHGLRRD